MDQEKNLQGRWRIKKHSMDRKDAEMTSEIVQGLPNVRAKIGYYVCAFI